MKSPYLKITENIDDLETGNLLSRYLTNNHVRIKADADFIMKNFPKDARILDVGAAPPGMLELLRAEGYTNLTFADLQADLFRKYSEVTGVRGIKANLLQDIDSLDLSSYDLICFNEVIEHIPGDIHEIFSSLINRMPKGCHVLITTPNLRSISGAISFFKHGSGLASKPRESLADQYTRKKSYGYYGHVREYTRMEIIGFFTSMNCRLVDESYQATYIKHAPWFQLCRFFENLLPRWRLFGKYLFVVK
jgi:hypothetical protein